MLAKHEIIQSLNFGLVRKAKAKSWLQGNPMSFKTAFEASDFIPKLAVHM